MRKIGIKQLKNHLSKELKDLPITVTSDGQAVATICSVAQWNKLIRGYHHEVATSLPIYNPALHKPGAHVLIPKGKRLIEAVVPELDAEGNPIY